MPRSALPRAPACTPTSWSRCSLAPDRKNCGRSPGITLTLTGTRRPIRPSRRISLCGGRSAPGETPRHASHGAPSPCPHGALMRYVRNAIKAAPELDSKDWTPRELRHSFVSLLSDHGLPIEEIARLVGLSSTVVTELVYRKQIRPVLQTGAVVMDSIFDH